MSGPILRYLPCILIFLVIVSFSFTTIRTSLNIGWLVGVILGIWGICAHYQYFKFVSVYSYWFVFAGFILVVINGLTWNLGWGIGVIIGLHGIIGHFKYIKYATPYSFWFLAVGFALAAIFSINRQKHC